jgi:hypothetical protein
MDGARLSAIGVRDRHIRHGRDDERARQYECA